MARLILGWKQPPSQAADDFRDLSSRLRATNRRAVEKIQGITQRVAEDRSWSRERLSAQDSPSKSPSRARNQKARTQLVIDGDGLEIVLSVSPYWTSTRRKDGTLYPLLFSAVAASGLSDALNRKGLVIAQERTKTSRRRGFSFSTTTHYVPFAGNSWLEAWARRRDRGEQIYRHKIRLDNPDLLERLVLNPALEATKRRGIPLWASMLESEFARG